MEIRRFLVSDHSGYEMDQMDVSKATSSKVIKSMRMISTGHVARMGEKRNAYKILVGKPE
jgi:hypothetical protein